LKLVWKTAGAGSGRSVVSGRPSFFQPSMPPSMTKTFFAPMVRNSHQTRGAVKMPGPSCTTMVSVSEMPSLPTSAAKNSGVAMVCGRPLVWSAMTS